MTMIKKMATFEEIKAYAKTGHGPCQGQGATKWLHTDKNVIVICKCALKGYAKAHPDAKFNTEDGFYTMVEESTEATDADRNAVPSAG